MQQVSVQQVNNLMYIFINNDNSFIARRLIFLLYRCIMWYIKYFVISQVHLINIFLSTLTTLQSYFFFLEDRRMFNHI